MHQLFAQISDPHLSTLEEVNARELFNKRALGYLSWRRRRRFEHRREVLDALVNDLQQYTLDQLLVTGDLTHIGLPLEFQQSRQWLELLGTPDQVALIPGNHDACVAADWQQTFALWQPYMDSDQPRSPAATFPSLRVRGDIAFIGLSTACPKPPLMATGTVGAVQLAKLPALLDDAAAAGLFRVVYLHHSPLPGKEKWRKRLTDADAVHRVLSGHGAELVLHGHGHRVHYDELATRDGMAPVIAVPSASAMGLKGGTPAQYNCYRVGRNDGGWELEIRSRAYQRGSGEFTECGQKVVQLPRQG
jgi:3',5'-cyclic AMP phosphodiesterase CpdA